MWKQNISSTNETVWTRSHARLVYMLCFSIILWRCWWETVITYYNCCAAQPQHWLKLMIIIPVLWSFMQMSLVYRLQYKIDCTASIYILSSLPSGHGHTTMFILSVRRTRTMIMRTESSVTRKHISFFINDLIPLYTSLRLQGRFLLHAYQMVKCDCHELLRYSETWLKRPPWIATTCFNGPLFRAQSSLYWKCTVNSDHLSTRPRLFAPGGGRFGKVLLHKHEVERKRFLSASCNAVEYMMEVSAISSQIISLFVSKNQLTSFFWPVMVLLQIFTSC